MLVKLRAFGKMLESDIREYPESMIFRSGRLNVPYWDSNIEFWKQRETPEALPTRYLTFEYRGERAEVDGKLVHIMELVQW